MGDRDIPTVPVTTLAGLTSTSDLLSELPVSDSLRSASSLNKSLLFHALVANESNNLLSVRDENLVRQLVTAIERTNSDNIELKSHYLMKEQEAHIDSCPELLQGIYNFRPAVFNTSLKINSPDQHTSNSYLSPECNTSKMSNLNEGLLQKQCRQTCINQFTSKTTGEISEEFLQLNMRGKSTENNNIKNIKNADRNQNKILTPNRQVKNSNPSEKTAQQPLIQEQYLSNPQELNFNSQYDFNQASTDVRQCVQSISDIFPRALESPNFSLESVNIPNILYLQSQPMTETETTQIQNSPLEYITKKEQKEVLELPGSTKSLIFKKDSLAYCSEHQQNHIASTTTSTSTSSSGKSQVRVCINRLNIKDTRLMQQSIKKFVQKSPALARSMGLLQESSQLQHENMSAVTEVSVKESGAVSTTNKINIPIDTFSTIKADEKRFSAKRKLAISIGDIPPEQIFSKPKVRRVERITPISSTKCLKDEITRSQTYQQFMRNMDQIIENLDDSESPNFDSEDVDESIECISPKLLNTMSTDVAKLKAKHGLDSIPKNKLTLLINYAMRNVYLARNYFAGPIFRKDRYDKIRNSILGDILTSIDRLPSSKKNLRPYKLTNNGGNIQMVTALVLQLIQCATILPDSLCDNGKLSNKSQESVVIDENTTGGDKKPVKPNQDILVLQKYDVAVSIGGNFLTTFLNKCKSRSNETDFRPLFENFIHDLLATVNKPEWPASELLLSLLGTMLVRYVSDKGIEQSIRLVSLDYLGIVAARLRKDTVESRCKVNIIDSMIMSIKVEQEKEGDFTENSDQFEFHPEERRTEFLQKILLDFLAVNAQEENLIWDYARHFYLAQWYRDVIYQRRQIKDGKKGLAVRKSKSRTKHRTDGEYLDTSDSGSCEEIDTEDIKKIGNPYIDNTDFELNIEVFNALEARKQYLINKIKPFSVSGEQNHSSNQHIKTYIDYNNAQLIAQYLATKRPFSQSFDGCLKKIILVVNEPSIAVRTRAMKCLANIVEVDPLVLKRKDMQMGVNQKFLDTAISVREAAVDLVGKFVLSNQELIDQYYDMLSTRILDTGVSVRKRVIKILRDICIEYPNFAKIPEICVKMIRRVNDEDGIQKLVTEVFMKMWFTPCIKNDKLGIQRKINQIIDVVNTAHDTGTTWLEGLLMSIFKPRDNMLKSDGCVQEPIKKNTEPPLDIVIACQQLADGLVDRLIELEDTDNARMLGCITTLHLLAKVRPQLLVRHAMTIEPYLNIKCHSATAAKFICAVADILEKVVPLVNNASESFLATLEEHLMLLVVSRNQAEVTSCVSCLGTLVNKITHNFKLIRDCFQKFYRVLDVSRNRVVQRNYSVDNIYTPSFRRSLFTIGILMRYFDFKSPIALGETNGGLPLSICDDVFDCLMFFSTCANQEIRKQALISLGSFCVLNDDYLTRSELKSLYCDILSSIANDAGFKIICMRNIWIYLTESEMFMHNKEKEWEKQSKHEDLKEMNDVSSGMASRIIQLYLEEILQCFLNRDNTVRLWAVKVIQIVLRQGLVHPVRMVPYLICLSTDPKVESAHRADALLKDIDKTYSGFVNMKVQFGLHLCFKLQKVLQISNTGKLEVIRGFASRGPDNVATALNDFLYSLLRTTKPQRRALVQTVTKQFDDQKTSLQQLLYIADNLAYFPYVVQDEPLYLIHQIDLLISMAGTHLLASFKEHLKPCDKERDVLEDDDDVEDPQVLFNRLPEDMTEIKKCITSAQACMLLLVLKDHLKDMYGITDSKISRYSPSEQKLYEKAVTRRSVTDFNPKTTIDVIKKQMSQQILSADINFPFTNEEKLDLVVKYLDFKLLMLKLDPEDGDSDAEESRNKSILNPSSTSDGISYPNLTKNAHLASDGYTDVLDVPISQIVKAPVSPSKAGVRKQNQVQSKKKRRKMESSDDENRCARCTNFSNCKGARYTFKGRCPETKSSAK
ncbi:nipped-B protein isoform X6 [Drosophila subpulchrella]|uniref:nipped-B protein isoform X6 n=1 Tax=Drosophila subpulchrella TaxID=1486046 RepID=UPI0018A1944A|nr:nipped-B protein isoform X6 [Drosophila subpulchrella]